MRSAPRPFKITDSIAKRFFAKVIVRGASDCWLWTGCRNSLGYGRFNIGENVIINASRVSLVISTGRNPLDMDCLHSCDNPSCVNPSHLRWGTHKENMKDKKIRGRGKPPKRHTVHESALTRDNAEYIKRLVLLGFSQSEVAKAYGVSPVVIYKAVHNKIKLFKGESRYV